MGTSKGYIAPTTSHWSTAKRAVTAFINNRDFDSKAKAASKYATAMKTDMSTGGSFQSAAARTLGFAQKVASGGLDNALREYNREDLIGKPSEVVWTELLHEFTNSGASVEDNMAADALSQAMDNLEIEDIADISNSDIRKIFGLGEKEKAKASRLLTSAVEGGYIKVMDPDTAPRYKKYIPYWA